MIRLFNIHKVFFLVEDADIIFEEEIPGKEQVNYFSVNLFYSKELLKVGNLSC